MIDPSINPTSADPTSADPTSTPLATTNTSTNPTSTNLATPARALAIGAHPDDIEFQCGATLAKWAAAGCVINHLILTDGSKGTWDRDADTAALVATRQSEQRAAAKALGSLGEVVFLDAIDGELEATIGRRGEVAYWIRRLRPDIVLGHDPWKRYRLHPDHRHAGWLTLDAVVAARDPHFFTQHEVAHHRPHTVWLFEADQPNHVEDVTDFAEAKVAALLEHASQFETTMAITASAHADDESARFRARIIDELRVAGQAAGFECGEAFTIINAG